MFPGSKKVRGILHSTYTLPTYRVAQVAGYNLYQIHIIHYKREWPSIAKRLLIRIVGIIFQVWLGPNAVLAFKREGYSWFDISFKDLFEVLKYPGFYKLAAKYIRYGSSEIIRSIIISLSGNSVANFEIWANCVQVL